MKNSKVLSLAMMALVCVGGLFSACASKPPMSGIASSANPNDEIAKLNENLDVARLTNVDVLAAEDFKKSAKSYDKAKEALSDGKDQEKILDYVRYSRIYLNDAYATAKNRAEKAPGLFEARQNAFRAWAARHSELKNEWQSTDQDVASAADKLDKMNADSVARLQSRYVELERKATIVTQLGSAQAKINGARQEAAARKSPETLKKAELSMKNAESVISTNVRSPQVYRTAVNQANVDANLLSEVTDTIQKNGKDLSESAALAMVAQRHQISDLKKDLNQTESNMAGVESQLNAKEQALVEQRRATADQRQTMGQALAEKDMALTSAEASVAMQEALEKSRAQFSPNEAEAYQQGGNLLIRLKSVGFASGQSDLPAQSMPLLLKVSEVAKSLHAKEIKVEGHTDSVGSAEVNKSISEKRATAVATYLKSNGFSNAQIESEGIGYERPIANNKSKEGRAQNRRVDIIITPDTKSSVE